ncbi:hypothetical protein FRB99_001718 [Tulasnella sp. 403]|nr:hypothetical protein FRB99_001718 [Tulasnella sp. 403]
MALTLFPDVEAERCGCSTDNRAPPVVVGQPRLLEFKSLPPPFSQELHTKHDIQFGALLPDQHSYIFKASSLLAPRGHLIVKFVNRAYGLVVHLATLGLAPKLYSTIPFAQPSGAYIMEYLDPEDGWMALQHLPGDNLHQNKDQIRAALDQILDKLSDVNFVHRDLCPNNIMVQLSTDNGPELKVIDFDWAGEVGKVWYPYT